MSRILRFFALVAVVLFSVNAFAGDPYGSCSAKKVYTECAKGYVLQNGECVLDSSGSCSAGQYWNGSECKSCPSTHPNSEAGASSESECYKTAELMKNGGSGTCFGKSGVNDGSITCYYGSTCALPSWNFSSCNMTNGSNIFKGWSLSDNATTGATGDFVHGNTYYAVWVTPSCNITNGTGEPTTASSNKPRCTVTCKSGYGTSGTYTGSTGATSVTYACTLASNTCSAGQYWDGSACQECTSGYYCPGGTWTGTSVQGRKSCPDGYENSAPGSVDESDCYLTTTAGKYVETPESAETTCAENGYCPGGIDVPYGDTDGRMACTANSSSAPGSDEISDCKCNAGYGGNAGVTGGTCTICAAGTYKTDSGNSSCSACTAGYYCTGGTNQTACAANSSSGAGSDAISDCKCNAGYGGNAGVTNGTCTICAAGKYKTSSGNSSCSTCTAGYYCTGGTNRTACTANSSSGAGSDEISDCQCNAGYGGNAGEINGTCTICAAGTYKTSSGNTSCSTCTEGYYCTGGTNQTTCPDGYGNSAPGSDAQSDCYMVVEAGKYLKEPYDTSPYACSKGSSTGEHEVYYGSVSQCSSCAPGSYTPYAGASCAGCPAGSYCTGDGQATRCPALYPNSSAGSDAATDCYTNTLTGQYIATPRAEAVTDCQAGTRAGAHTVFYGDTSQCHVCKANQWSGDAAGSCQTCPSGWANDGATAADHAYISSCKHTVQAGNWYNSDNSTFDTCAADTYSEAHMAGYGVSTSCEPCNTGYTNNTDHTACVAIKYTVKYNANEGSGTTAPSSHQYGVAKTLTANGFTRTGYTFAGWATSPSGDVVYANQQSVTNLTSTQGATVNLYAKWTANNYSIYLFFSPYNTPGTTILYTTYDTNVYLDSNRSQAMTTNANPITKPTRTGYTFGGYYSESDGTGTEYINANGYITSAGLSAGKECASTSGCKWYAKWTQDCYQITLDNTTNGGTGGTTVLYKTYNSNLWYSDSSCSTQVTTITKPSKTNASYSSHFTSASGGGTQYISDSGSLLSKTVTGPITLYARYNCDANWRGSGTTISGTCTGTQSTVSFNVNGGTGGQTNNVTATYGSEMPTISTTAPTRTGYTFDGWYDAQTGGTQYYNPNGASARTWDKTANTTLYAQWTANTYTVSFNANGGTGGQTASVTATYGSQMPTISTTPPTRTGYAFNGWYDAPTGGNRYYTAAGASARTWDKTADTTLYAQWAAKGYVIYLQPYPYNTAGTQYLHTRYDTNVYLDSNRSQAMTTSANPITKPTRDNYTFAGYYSGSGGTGTEYIDADGYITSAGLSAGKEMLDSSAWYARWTGNPYTVSFDANGGTGGQTDDVTATYGSQMPTISTTAPTRTGYTFNGWYDAPTGGNLYYFSTGASARTWDKTADTTLYAQWKAENYTIALHTDWVTTSGTVFLYTTYDTNVYLDSNRSQAMTTSANPITKPTWDNYTFAGYYSGSGGTGTEYIDADGYITSAGLSAGKECTSCTWYAKRIPNCYKITLDNTTNGGTGGTTVLYKPFNSDVWYSDSSCSTQVTTITKPTKTNAVYNGHYTNASSGGTQYISDSGSLLSRTVTGPTTLYARYDCDANWRGSGTTISGTCTGTQSTVSFNVNGGTGGQTSNVTATYGSEMPTISTTAPTRTGYTFDGWYDAQTGGNQYYTAAGDSARTWDKTANTTLYAQWTVNTYKCTSGQYLNVTSCETCTAGYYCPSSSVTYTYNGSVQGRTECGGGKYSSDGATSCSNITAGCYGTSASSSCPAVCGTNTYSNAGASSCSSCPTGYKNSGNTAASHAGSESCIITVSGGYYIGTSGDNSSNWDECAGGTYKASHTVAYGSTSSCETCGTGYYCPAGADGQSLCADLGGGLYSESGEGSDATDDCYATVPATKYLSSTTSTSFTPCTAGYYCPGMTLYYANTGGRTGCGSGKYSEEGSDASSDCKEISAGCYGTSASSACPYTCSPGSYSTGGAAGCMICNNKPTNSSYTDATGNPSADCPWTCDEGYNQTSDNQCGQFCTAGITHIKLSNGLSVPLYSSARTNPAINVQVNNSICYGSLATGQSSGALNVKVGSTTYHAIN